MGISRGRFFKRVACEIPVYNLLSGENMILSLFILVYFFILNCVNNARENTILTTLPNHDFRQPMSVWDTLPLAYNLNIFCNTLTQHFGLYLNDFRFPSEECNKKHEKQKHVVTNTTRNVHGISKIPTTPRMTDKAVNSYIINKPKCTLYHIAHVSS